MEKGSEWQNLFYFPTRKEKGEFLPPPFNVNFCKDHRDKIEVPDPLAVEDLISSKLCNQPC